MIAQHLSTDDKGVTTINLPLIESSVDLDVTASTVFFMRHALFSRESLMPIPWAERVFGADKQQSGWNRPRVSSRYAVLVPTPVGHQSWKGDTGVTALVAYYDLKTNSHKVARADYGCAHKNAVHSTPSNCYHVTECPDCGARGTTDSGD